MYKRGFVGFCIIVVFLSLLVFASGNISTNIEGNNITLSTNFTGDFYEFLVTNTTIQFNASLFNQSNNSSLTNTTAGCFLNLSTEGSLLGMDFTSESNQFWYETEFDSIRRDISYSIYCNSTLFDLTSEAINFSVSQELRPTLITTFIDEVTSEIVKELTYYSWINQSVYVELQNVSNVLKGANVSTINSAICEVNIFNTNYSLPLDLYLGSEFYQNDSVFFENFGMIPYGLTCEYEGINYIWEDVLEVNEYKPSFEFSQDLGGAVDIGGNRPLSLILNNNRLFMLHNEEDYSYFSHDESFFNLIFNNRSSDVNKNSILSLLSSNILLNFGPTDNVGRFHNIQDQSDAIELDNSVFQKAQLSFLTTFDTNNDGNFESLVFFRNDNSETKSYVIFENNSYLELSDLALRSGFSCYEDLNNNGFFDVIISGQIPGGTSRQTNFFTNYNFAFELNRTFSFGLSDGSCHISRFLENDETNILIIGLSGYTPPPQNQPIPQIFLFESFEHLLNENNTISERIPDIEPLFNSDIVVADFDNSGLKDIIMCGQNATGDAKTYFLKQNMTNPGYFYILDEFQHPNVTKCSISISHLDNSSTPEIAIGGVGGDNKIKVYFTQPPRFKPNPNPPVLNPIEFNSETNQLTISWNETDPIHSYNLKLSYLNGTEIMSGFYPISTHPAQGYLGNMRYRTNVTLNNIQNSLVSVSVQAFDEALRKSEWSQPLINDCQPPNDSNIWVITEYCPITQTTLPALNITINETGILDIQQNLTSPHTNITVLGELKAQNITVHSIVYNTTKKLQNLQTFAEVQVLQNTTLERVNLSNLRIFANVTILDSQVIKQVLGDGVAYTNITTTFSYLNQFLEPILNVVQNVTGVQTTNTTQVLLHSIQTNSSEKNYSYNTTFSKPLHYTKTQLIIPNQTILIELRRTPEPIITGFDILSNFSEILTGNESQDIQLLSNLPQFRIGKEQFGKIVWNNPVNISYLNISNYIQIQNNSISVNHSNLNTPANLTFFNLIYQEKPVILRDNVVCQNCSNPNYEGNNFTVTVPGFSTYTTTANAFIEFTSPSIIITNQTYNISVRYLQKNTSEVISDANCVFEDDEQVLNLNFAENMYQNSTVYNSSGDFTAIIHCSASGFEPITLEQNLRVLSEGVFFLRTTDSFIGLGRASAGFFDGNIYYHGIANSILYPYINSESQQTSSVTGQDLVPFSLTDLNNDGNLQKIITTNFAQLNNIDNLRFITADIDNDGDIDVIYCGKEEIGILRNNFAQNEHNTKTQPSFTKFVKTIPSLNNCAITYTAYNNTKYVAMQGRTSGDENKLYLFKINQTTELELLNNVTGLRNGELQFKLIDNQILFLIQTGLRTDFPTTANTTIYELQNNQLQLSQLQIQEKYYDSSITSITLPNETYPIILISGKNQSSQETINAYQYNTTHLTKRNDLIQDLEPFSRGSAIFFEQDNQLKLFTVGSNQANLFTYFATDTTTPTKPQTPTITKSNYNPTTKELFIEWTQIPNATYQLKVGEVSQPHRFVSGNTGSSTNPTQNQQGNMFSQTNITLQQMPNTCFQIQVKAISNAYIHGNWSEINQENPGTGYHPQGLYDINCNGIYHDPNPPQSPPSNAASVAGTPIIQPSEPEPETIERDETTTNGEETTEQPTPQPSQPQYSQELTIEKLISSLTNNSIRHTQIVQHTRTHTIIKDTFRNIGLFPLDFLVFMDFPKDILPSLQHFQTNKDFEIIAENPEIVFSATQVGSYRDFSIEYSLPNRLTDEQIQSISYSIVIESEKDYSDVEQSIADTKDVLNVTQSFRTTEDQTIFTIDLNLDSNAILTNLSIYQEIPKCLLEIINEQVAESDVRFEIVEADPLIVWHFDELINPQKIQLAINAIADEDCINQAVSVALARQIIFSQAEIDYKNVVLALLFIPLLALLFVLIDIFTKHNTHNRKEIDYLVRYIKSHIHKGVPLWKIRAHLLQNGHDKNDVKEAEKLNAKNVVHKYTQYFNISIHEFFLLFLIILNLLDFLQILSGDIDYFKKILSFVILGYLLLRVSVTSILIGKRILSIDILLLFSFFAMTIKNLVGFAKNAIHEVNFVQDLYAFMWRENQFFEVTLFITGILGLLIATILLAREIPRSPSLVDTFLKKQHFLKRIFLIHLLLVTFFITVFNLMFEWLAIAVDSFVLITTIVIVIFLLIKHHKRLSPSEVLEEIAEDSEKLYEKVLYLFHYKKFLPLAFSAMLILYVLTEIANFLIPYLTGIYSVIYFGSFDTLHRPLFYLQDFLNPEYSLFANQIQFISLFDSILVFFAYALNVIAMLYLLILPARFWWHHYTQRKLPFFEKTHFILGKKELALFVTSILVFFARPIFEMQNLRTYDIIGGVHTLVGVDILTKPIILSNLDITLLLAALSGLIFYILAIFYKKAVNHIVLFFSLGFFTYYITIFFTSQFSYYLEMIRILLLSNILLAIYFILFALATALCIYGIGYITILYLYLPTPLQNFIHKHSLTIAFLKHQSHHHVHNKTVSKDSEKDIETYITKSLASKHELFYIIEHLEEKGYSIEDIETGIHKAISDKELLKGKDHINHYHHNKELIKALHTYIKKEYKKRDLKDIIDDVLKRSFTPKEILGGLQHLHTIAKPDDQLAQQLLTNPLTLFKLSKRKNIDTKVVIATLKTFHPIQIDLLTKALIHRLYRKYPSLQDILLHAKDFRFTEEDVRLALYHIHPKNASDTEILKYI